MNFNQFTIEKYIRRYDKNEIGYKYSPKEIVKLATSSKVNSSYKIMGFFDNYDEAKNTLKSYTSVISADMAVIYVLESSEINEHGELIDDGVYDFAPICEYRFNDYFERNSIGTLIDEYTSDSELIELWDRGGNGKFCCDKAVDFVTTLKDYANYSYDEANKLIDFLIKYEAWKFIIDMEPAADTFEIETLD